MHAAIFIDAIIDIKKSGFLLRHKRRLGKPSGYVSRDTTPMIEKYLSKLGFIKITCSWRVNGLRYEHWTDRRKYFYAKENGT